MRIYLAGPMRGIPEFNFPAFYAAAARLRAEGHDVFNPAERDNEKYSTNISKGNATGSEAVAVKEHGFSLRDALAADLEYICHHAEAIALLPGWERSKGVAAELATARALGLQEIALTLTTNAAKRKASPVFSGVMRYFPDALAAVARLSKIGNDKHNPGEPLHWSRDKSNDHGDCLVRHQLEFDQVDPETGELHAVAVAWRALAQLQLLEEVRAAKS